MDGHLSGRNPNGGNPNNREQKDQEVLDDLTVLADTKDPLSDGDLGGSAPLGPQAESEDLSVLSNIHRGSWQPAEEIARENSKENRRDSDERKAATDEADKDRAEERVSDAARPSQNCSSDQEKKDAQNQKVE